MIRDRNLVLGAVMVLSVLLSLAMPQELSAQATIRETAGFAFVVKITNNSIDLTCMKGCAWKTLSFSAQVDGAPQAVDQSGMTTRRSERSEESPGLASFLFTIQRTADGVKLQGTKGSAWTSLSFSCPSGGCEQVVDQFGMVAAEAR